MRHHKFPPGCKGHVSKFSIQSFYYPWYRVQCSQQKRFMTAYHEQTLFSRLQYVYKIFNNINCPKQLTDYSVKWSQRNCRSLRDSTLSDLPQFKTKCGQTSFKLSAAGDWSTLPRELAEQKTISQFKQRTFTYLMDTDIINHISSI